MEQKIPPFCLVFDTETAGLARSWHAPLSDSDNWPRLVQLAWDLYNKEGELIERKVYTIRPVGFTIPEEATAVHGISQEEALHVGVNLASVLREFLPRLHQAQLLVAHNYDFDSKIVGAELHRLSMNFDWESASSYCTMKSATEFCQIPSRFGYKWPTLVELYQKLFNTGFPGAHNALNDVVACARCFFELRQLGVLV
ncbi:3'-5' exonuclease [Hymenobacter busanensis]|uniref:3'-5' exonuclease n=1 Tax=Hymenobacter busanensis TaxID=2607656 RepID=A0A7L5A450_9BACT|nr:3'-5' exonuclease [Hymenobacter busanensis]KAA9338719.1 3'-5' exonuclease [Hymenobacter busanensis]QHJ08850.1 3'-5' exonuclease [Hymenobacter busanensis]